MIEDELGKLISSTGTGMKREYAPDANGFNRLVVKAREMMAGDPSLRGRMQVPAGSAISPTEAPLRAPMRQAEPRDMTAGEIGQEMKSSISGLGAGVVAGTLGIPGDIIGLGYGLWRAANPDADEGRLAAFIEGISTVSEAGGSEYFLNKYADWLEANNVPADQAKLMREAANIGSIATLEAAVLKAPKAVRLGKEWLAAAPERLEAAKGTTTLGAIGDIGKTADELIVGAQKIMGGGEIDESIISMQKRTPPVERDELINILRLKADQMRLKEKDRIQPSGENPLFNTTEESYNTTTKLEQKETPVPRAPEGGKLPLNNRAQILIDKADEISDKIADNIRPHLNSKVRYFYHVGPLVEKAKELGIPEDVALKQLKRFALNYAATSPRTPIEPNLRSASVVMAKETRGVNYDEILGPGTGGISEIGYPMMVGPTGIHKKLIDAIRAEGINYNTNPKPATFAENVSGNLQGVTADTHAIRGVLDALNDIAPGSIPKEWFGETMAQQKKLYEEYTKNPAGLKPIKEVLPGTLKSQKINGQDAQVEYAIISDLYKMAAKKLGITPAEAQAIHWFKQGHRTGLVSEEKTIVDIIDERVDVTAQATGRSKENVFLDFFSGKIPLMSLGGITLLEAGTHMPQNNNEAM